MFRLSKGCAAFISGIMVMAGILCAAEPACAGNGEGSSAEESIKAEVRFLTRPSGEYYVLGNSGTRYLVVRDYSPDGGKAAEETAPEYSIVSGTYRKAYILRTKDGRTFLPIEPRKGMASSGEKMNLKYCCDAETMLGSEKSELLKLMLSELYSELEPEDGELSMDALAASELLMLEILQDMRNDDFKAVKSNLKSTDCLRSSCIPADYYKVSLAGTPAEKYYRELSEKVAELISSGLQGGENWEVRIWRGTGDGKKQGGAEAYLEIPSPQEADSRRSELISQSGNGEQEEESTESAGNNSKARREWLAEILDNKLFFFLAIIAAAYFFAVYTLLKGKETGTKH